MKLMEREGYGIPLMPNYLREYGLRPPDFNYDGGYFVVNFYGREKSSPEYRLRPEHRSQLKPRQLEILNLIWERGRVTSEEITKKFDITRETATQDFRKLLELGLIERKGSGRAPTMYLRVFNSDYFLRYVLLEDNSSFISLITIIRAQHSVRNTSVFRQVSYMEALLSDSCQICVR